MPNVSTPPAVAAATEAIGGACVPLTAALRGLGWPFLSRSAIHARRLAGTLPVMPRRLGDRWVVYAVDAAPLFERNEPKIATESATPAHRGPGRPRKRKRECGDEPVEWASGFAAIATEEVAAHAASKIEGEGRT